MGTARNVPPGPAHPEDPDRRPPTGAAPITVRTVPDSAAPIEPIWVDEDAALDDAVAALLAADRYALDTEFQGERTYYPTLALVQLSDGQRIWLIDPLACDVTRLRPLLEGPGTMLAHAARQDLEILVREAGCAPARLIDTQIAAAFAGAGNQSLLTLCKRHLGVTLEKGDRLTDWTARPLRESARRYAALDVAHLHDLTDRLREAVGEERWGWALDECEASRVPPTPADPTRAWWRVRGARSLRGDRARVAQCVCAWREQTARSRNIPPRNVMGDLGLDSVIARMPRSKADLDGCRGVPSDARSVQAILDAVAEGLAMPPEALVVAPDEPDDRGLGAAITLAGALVAQRARGLDLDPAMVAARADITAIVAGRPGRLDVGWRAQVVGDLVHRLLAGEITLRLADGGRTLVIDGT